MNRYPLWKYLLVLATLVIGFIYTLPNFFGEVPAVHVSAVRAANKADEALLKRIEADLKAGGIAFDATLLERAESRCAFATPTRRSRPRTCCNPSSATVTSWR